MRATVHPNRFTQQAIEPVFDQLPTLTELFMALEPQHFTDGEAEALTRETTQTAWRVAIAAMTQLLKQTTLNSSHSNRLFAQPTTEVCNQQGVVFCSPVPVFSDLAILSHLKTWIFTPERPSGYFKLPPASVSEHLEASLPTLPIPAGDPLAHEQFCLIQTAQFCWAAVLGCDAEGTLRLHFSFDPATVEQIWMALQFRVERLQWPAQAALIEQWRSRFPATAPDYRIPMQFSQALLAQSAHSSPRIPQAEQTNRWKSSCSTQKQRQYGTLPISAPVTLSENLDDPEPDRDVELLKVLAHEVRTPLTTIQTLTRLLLRRSDLPKVVIQRLEAIQQECLGQIDRFGLIFRAMELTHADCQPLPTHLTPIALQELLIDNLTRWQAHAARRGLTLQVSTPKRLPEVAIRDPHLLNQVLTGLMEYLSNSLSVGSHINLKVDLAGSQLKLQLQTQPDQNRQDVSAESPMMKAVGQLLMFQPETGGVSLSLAATKHLFQALGGKLTVRQHLEGEVLTIFLPLGTKREAY
jgi:hypothetical protein